jgi:CheY-like chemotaxis protein
MLIVVVDDNAEMFEDIYKELIPGFGLPDLEVEYYYSGKDFFDMLNKNPDRINSIDLVLLDHSFDSERGDSIYNELQRLRPGIQIRGVSVEIERQREYLGKDAIGKQQALKPEWLLSWYIDHKGNNVK